jgi:hypothetical protein
MTDKLTTMQISGKTRIRLNIMKQKLGCKSLEEVIERILRIVPASELNKMEKENG